MIQNERGATTPRWLIPVAIVGALVLLIVLPLVASYNGMVEKSSSVDRSFADLDAQLQRRNDLIPNLVSSVKAALNQEQTVFGDLAKARAAYSGASSPSEKVAAANDISSGIGRLLVIVESYPQLQSNQNIRDLMTQLEGTENRIAQARRDYNGEVTAYNISIRRFPRNLTAGIFGFHPRPLLEAPPEARTVPKVDLGNQPVPTAPR